MPSIASKSASAAPLVQFDPTTPIPDDVALGNIGRQLLSEWTDGARVAKTGTACDAAVPGAVLLTDAVLIVDGVERPVLISGVPADGTIAALDPDTCVVVVTGR